MRSRPALLSPNEEITFRRVAIGSTPPDKLSAEHLKRLEVLRLIEADEGDFRLTLRGRQHYNGLPRPAGLTSDGSLQEIEQILSDVIRSTESRTGSSGRAADFGGSMNQRARTRPQPRRRTTRG